MSNIRVSEKHGVNPCMPVCFWCGEECNEIALLGRLPGDAKAPMSAVINYQPCEKCLDGMNMGITLIEVSDKPLQKEQPPLSKNAFPLAYPTGNYLVMNSKAIINLIDDVSLRNNIIKGRKCLLDLKTFKFLNDKIKRDLAQCAEEENNAIKELQPSNKSENNL